MDLLTQNGKMTPANLIHSKVGKNCGSVAKSKVSETNVKLTSGCWTITVARAGKE